MGRFTPDDSGPAGAANVVDLVKPGVAVAMVAAYRTPDHMPGVAITQGASSARSATHAPAVALSHSTGLANVTATAPGVLLSQQIAAPAPTNVPGVDIKQIAIGLSRLVPGAGTAGYVVAARNDWTNPANADGFGNGVYSSFAGNLLAARAGGISIPFAATTGKTALTITSVTLTFAGQQTGVVPVTSPGTLVIGYTSSTGARVVLESFTANIGFLAGRVYDLTSVVAGDWTKLPTAAWAECSTAAANLSAADIDCCFLQVVANVTDTP